MAWLPGLRAWLPGAGIMLAAALAALLAHWMSVRIVPHVPVPWRARGFVQTFVASTTSRPRRVRAGLP